MPRPHPITLRSLPKRFTTVLRGRDGERAEVWDLSPFGTPVHPLAFTPLVDGAQNNLEREGQPGQMAGDVRPGLQSAGDDVLVSPAAERLAGAIVLAIRAVRDPRTLTCWGQEVGISRGALRVWCSAAGVPARSCLDFLRVLRAVVLSANQPWNLRGVLDVVDQRSLFNLLDRGGVRALCEEGPPTVDTFMRSQRFLTDQQVIQAVARRLAEVEVG